MSLKGKGIAFAVLAPFLYALMSVTVKFIPLAQLEFVVFARFLFGFLLLSPFFFLYRKHFGFKQLKLHLMRAVFATLCVYCSIYGIRNLTLVDAILLESTVPLFIPLIVWGLHQQKITICSAFILLLGFSAIVLLLKPTLEIFHWASLASLGAGFTAAVAAVSINALSKTEHPIAILFYFNLFSGALSFVPCMYSWSRVFPGFSYWQPLVLISLFGVLFQYAITRAFGLIAPHIAGSFAYFNVLFSALLGWLLWQEKLDGIQILGGLLLIGSGLLMLQAHRRKSLRDVL